MRRRLIEGHGRLPVILSSTVAWVLDTLLVERLKQHHVVARSFDPLLDGFERLSTVMFVIVTIDLAVALYRSRNHSLLRWALLYLVLAMVQVMANVVGMVSTGSKVKDDGLASLWVVGAVYMESVVVFMFIYIFLDVATPGGAFIRPSRDGEPPPAPHLIDICSSP